MLAGRWLLALAALGFTLLPCGKLHAQATVTTLGGGSAVKPYDGYVDGNTLTAAKFDMPAGLALDPSGTYLFIADYTNNAIRLVSNLGDTANSVTTTFANATNGAGISHPLAVAVDGATNVYVLNHGNGTNGALLHLSGLYMNSGLVLIYTPLASNLANATAMAMDGYDNLYVTVNGNKVIRVTTNKVVTTVGTISQPGTSLQGIAVLDNGQLALTDAGNNGIWLMNPATGIATKFTGFHGGGDTNGPPQFASFNTPETIAKAGNGMLVFADRGNNKVKLVDQNGTVSLLYGVSSNLWVTGTGQFPGWYDGPGTSTQGSAESRQPYGVVVGPNGNVYVTEDYYHVLREVTGTGLTGPQPGYPPLFNGPAGIAYDGLGNYLFIANYTNNSVQLLDLGNNATYTFLTAADGIQNPASVLVDTNENVYVLNQGTMGNGFIEEYDIYGNDYGPIVSGLNWPTAFTLDGYGNFIVTEQSGAIRDFGVNTSTTIATITNANVSLQGVALFDDGTIAVSDAGNQVIWTVNSITKQVSLLTGKVGVSGIAVGSTNFARLNQPHQLVRVGGNQIVGADYGNNRLVLIQRTGYLITNNLTYHLNSTNATLWFGNNNDPVTSSDPQFVPMVIPFGVAAGSGGEIFASEDYYGDIRGLTGTGLTSPTFNPEVPLPAYSNPAGIALNNEGTSLFIANPTNNTISQLDLTGNQTTVYLDSNNGINQPVDVALDSSDNLYVLNQGTGGNGYLLEFDRFGNLLATNAAGLSQPTAMTFDSSGNIMVAESAGAVIQVSSGVSTTIATVTNAGVQLQGIALFTDGTIALSDAGNQVIWQVDPATKAVSLFTGQFDSPGTNFGSPAFARLNQPHQLKLAAGNLLVAADTGNNRIVIVDRSGAINNALISTNATVWFGLPDDPFGSSSLEFVPMVSPVGVAIGSAGGVFASETYYNDIREILGTTIGQPGAGGGGGSGTNIVVVPPTISPNSGYYPMGQTILVQSPVSQVFYTTDGTDPTTNSTPVSISGNIGYIHWSNPTNDLTSLRLRSFLNGTNASAVVSGQPVAAATIGVPQFYGTNSVFSADNTVLSAGIGSSIVIPVVCDLAASEQIQSYQFRMEIAPLNNSNTPVILPLSIIPTNDFVPLVTAAQGGVVASNTISAYSLGMTNGLVIFAVGSGTHVLFHNYAVVALLEVQIPYNANEGDTYALNVLYPSATADAYNTPVPLAAMPEMTIIVTNIPYTVGDSASTSGTWYNAGTFGDDNLDNSDVNQAFYAASGLRVPYAFSDAFNAMDAYPPDAAGFVGGDGQIRFLDWVTILNRSLRLDPGNWSREWSAGGALIDYSTNLVSHALTAPLTGTSPKVSPSGPWYRQVLLGADSVGNVAANSTVYVPLYAKLADGSSLSGLQFRAVITPQNGAPALTTSPQLNLAAGVAAPMLTQSFKAGETAFGWPLGSFNYLSRSSNFLGWISFTVPTNAVAGQSYQVSLYNADGAPDATNQYDFETRSATVAVNTSAPPATVCSDDWKIHFFGSVTNPAAADNADPDGDGVPNWMEFLAGTDPTDARSKLQLGCAGSVAGKGQNQMQLNWLTAPGRAYALQWSTSLVGGAWNTLTTVSGDGAPATCVDTNNAGPQHYYRLYLLP